MPTLIDALRLAAAGWAVLPIDPGTKRPAGALAPHGTHDASTDPEALTRMFPRGSMLNIGARIPTTLVVLDFDPRNGGTVAGLEAMAGHCLPETLTTISGSAPDSCHLWFLRPHSSSLPKHLHAPGSAELLTGIDVLTHPRYCIVPPSLHAETGRPYTWKVRPPVPLPGWVLDLLTPAVRSPRAVVSIRTDLTRQHDALVGWVRRAEPGRRNSVLYGAAYQAAMEGAHQDVFDRLRAAAVEVGLTEAETAATIRSAQRREASS